MPTVSIGGMHLDAPDDYAPKLVILTGAPEKVGGQKELYAKNVVISAELVAEGTSTQAFADAQVGNLVVNQEGFRRINTTEISIAGQTCPLIEAQALGPGGAIYGQLIAYLVRGHTGYILSGSHVLGRQFTEAKDEYRALFASLELVG